MSTTATIENAKLPDISTLEMTSSTSAIYRSGPIMRGINEPDISRIQLAHEFFELLYGSISTPYGAASIYNRNQCKMAFTQPSDSWKLAVKTVESAKVSSLESDSKKLIKVVDDVFFTVNLLRLNAIHGIVKRRGRGSGDEIASVIGLVADVDADKEHKAADGSEYPSRELALSVLNSMPILPTCVVSSSGKDTGGLHVYWLFSKPFEINTEADKNYIKNMSKQWQRHLRKRLAPYKLDSTHDLTRILRAPGSRRKDGSIVFILGSDGSRRYAPEDFQPYIEPEATYTAKKGFASRHSLAPDTQPLSDVQIQDMPENEAKGFPAQDLEYLNRAIEALRINAAKGYTRHTKDFSFCCRAHERGWSEKCVWQAVQNVSKFATDGIDYFKLTWKKSAEAVNANHASFSHTPSTSYIDSEEKDQEKARITLENKHQALERRFMALEEEFQPYKKLREQRRKAEADAQAAEELTSNDLSHDIASKECPEPGSELSQYEREMHWAGRMFSCERCRRRAQESDEFILSLPCEECSKLMGVSRRWPGKRPCKRIPIHLSLISDSRHNVIAQIACGRWDCPTCGWSKEYKHRVHLSACFEELEKGILWQPHQDMENLTRTRHLIWRKNAYQIANVHTHDKKAVKDHLSRLKKAFGVFWCRVYLGHEKYTYLVLLPRIKQGKKRRPIISPNELHYKGVRGSNKGKQYRASKITISEFRLALTTAISTAGNTLKLDRPYVDQAKSIKKLNKHQPLTYCKEWSLPRSSKKTSRYKKEPDLCGSVEDILEAAKPYVDEGLTITDRNIHDVDKSCCRGMVPTLGRWIRFIFPKHWSDDKVRRVKEELFKCPWTVPLGEPFPVTKHPPRATFKQTMLC